MPSFSGVAVTAPAAQVTPSVIVQSPGAVMVGTNLAWPALVLAARSTGLPPSGAESPVVVGAAEKVTVVPSATGAPLSVTATSRNTSPAKVLPVTFRRYGPIRRFGSTVCISWRGGATIVVDMGCAQTTAGAARPRKIPQHIFMIGMALAPDQPVRHG